MPLAHAMHREFVVLYPYMDMGYTPICIWDTPLYVYGIYPYMYMGYTPICISWGVRFSIPLYVYGIYPCMYIMGSSLFYRSLYPYINLLYTPICICEETYVFEKRPATPTCLQNETGPFQPQTRLRARKSIGKET